jgi:hypothetical protein
MFDAAAHEQAVLLAGSWRSPPRSERVNTRDMSEEILDAVNGPFTTIRLHRPEELPTVGGRELTSGVVGDILGDRFAEFG